MSLPPFQAVLDEHRDALWRYLVASVGPVDAADCLQETLLAALRAYPRLRPGSDVRAWLVTIAHHKAIDSHRARGRRADPVADVPERAGVPPTDGEPALWAAVGCLPPKQKEAVVARFVGDLPFAEVGRLLGCSEDAARQNVRAGLQRLRATLRRDEEPDT